MNHVPHRNKVNDLIIGLQFYPQGQMNFSTACHGLTVMSALLSKSAGHISPLSWPDGHECNGLTVMSALWSKSASHIRPPKGGSPIMGIIYIFHYRYFITGTTWMPRSNMDGKEQHGGQGATWRPKSNMEAK